MLNGVSTSGQVLYRYGVNQSSHYNGTSWSTLISTNGVRMKQISAGNCTLWAVSENNSLYFRENVTSTYPEVKIFSIN